MAKINKDLLVGMSVQSEFPQQVITRRVRGFTVYNCYSTVEGKIEIAPREKDVPSLLVESEWYGKHQPGVGDFICIDNLGGVTVIKKTDTSIDISDIMTIISSWTSVENHLADLRECIPQISMEAGIMDRLEKAIKDLYPLK